ncbi:SDR family NAD(P)-dependent oxidoreductase [Streptococcus salivarius]|uniref:SDR family NAD(P)-dependent oxidoreductase n=1 Tax=Streptococcus salivarius TaxID=1304 RepID=UPI00321BDDED
MQTTDSFSKAIILGATGGIGRQLAKELARRLDHLVLVGRDSDKLVQLQNELAGSKAQLSIKVLNLCDKEALENFGKALDADLLVNCAGLASFSIGSDLATEKEQELWQVNYHAPVQLMKLLVQKNRKIRLVQLSSLAALYPHPYLAAYSSSKAALQTYTLALQEELSQSDSPVQLGLYILGPVQTGIFPPKLVEALGGSRLQMKPEKVAQQLIRLIERDTSYAVIGLRYRLLVLLGRLLPQRWITRLLARYLRKGLNR